jgi:hypothetical protein
MLFSYVQEFLDMIPGLVVHTVDQCAYDVLPYTKRVLKGYKFMATNCWMQPAVQHCQCPGKLYTLLIQ